MCPALGGMISVATSVCEHRAYSKEIFRVHQIQCIAWHVWFSVRQLQNTHPTVVVQSLKLLCRTLIALLLTGTGRGLLCLTAPKLTTPPVHFAPCRLRGITVTRSWYGSSLWIESWAWQQAICLLPSINPGRATVVVAEIKCVHWSVVDLQDVACGSQRLFSMAVRPYGKHVALRRPKRQFGAGSRRLLKKPPAAQRTYFRNRRLSVLWSYQMIDTKK